MHLCSINGSLDRAVASLPRRERVAVAEIQDRVGSHPPLESDARQEKKSYKLKAESGKPESSGLELVAVNLHSSEAVTCVELPTIGGNARRR